ncbi:MAG: TonB-dependent receptor [Sphingomonadaceae bacterium]|nr:TonB-dependent receptor [Sphingomonadaceae bacterium]
MAAAPGFAQEASEASDEPAEEEAEEIVVQATRSGRRVQDEPVRVEVISGEEIDEKLLMTPGNISMLVAETGGLRVQVTSPALGAANVRVRGLEGRYTQLLADGLPLYGQASSIGLLQIAPTDLGQVEVIKGAASALYGPSALGGVINLVARRPGDAPEAELLLNATTRDGQDATAYAASPLGDDWGYSLVGGYHRQSRKDLDDDGWIDMPGYERFTVRPRLFWEGAGGAKAFATVGAMIEDRVGGTLAGRTVPDGRPFAQTQDTRRFDAGLVAEAPVGDLGTFHVRASGMTQNHDHRFGDIAEDDRHGTLFGEASFAAGGDRTSWLVGAAAQRDSFRSRTFAALDYSYTVPGLFAQIEHEATNDLTLAASGRFDDHSNYGSFLSPRVSALFRPGRWTVRASLGRGFYAPTPFVDEIEAAGLSRLAPLTGLKAETANTASLDVGYAFGRTEFIAAFFASDVDDAVRLATTGPRSVRLVNVAGPTHTRGVELLARHRWEQFSITGTYIHVDATEPEDAGTGRRAVPRTPRHTAGFVAMWEAHGKGRLGIEVYYTGRQRLEDNPFRNVSRPYVELGLLGEIVLGRASLFVNLENILGVRQTKYDPLVRPDRAPDGRWTVDVWAPTEGFVVNGGVRVKFGGDS